jgi:hypothetical protein
LNDLNQAPICGGCGEEIAAGSTICPSCGWDLTTAVGRPARRSPWAALRAGGWRVLVLAALVCAPVLGFFRLQITGPGPTLATTLRWLVLGDRGRAAELVTIHRAYELGSATSRYAVRELAPPSFEGDWEKQVAPYATMLVRGWIPLLFYGATTEMAPQSVREVYRVRAVDGWGRPYRITTRQLERGTDWEADPEVAADLAVGLQESFFTRGRPDFGSADWLRLVVVSAGRDGEHDTGDDIRMITYLAVGFTLKLSRAPGDLQRQLDAAYDLGRHYYRFEGNRYDLIDARMLAEFRLETLS